MLALLTKADKLKSGKRKAQVLMAREAAMAFCGDVTVHAFSSLKRIGVSELERTLDQWLQLAQAPTSESDESIEPMSS